MIRFATLHNMGRWDTRRQQRDWQYILKYFDPLDPTESLTAEYVGSKLKPDIPEDTCLIQETDQQLFDWTKANAPTQAWILTEQFMWNAGAWYVWIDTWNDAGFLDRQVFGEPINHRKLLLFCFWHRHRVSWNKKLFLECQPNIMQRTGRWGR